jgi:hypothetical protein
LYEGDSIIRPGPTPWEAGGKQADATMGFVQRDSAAIDLARIEARARALRAAAIAELASQFWTWLGGALERGRRRREEEYLARAQNIAELEARLRNLERQGRLLHV